MTRLAWAGIQTGVWVPGACGKFTLLSDRLSPDGRPPRRWRGSRARYPEPEPNRL